MKKNSRKVMNTMPTTRNRAMPLLGQAKLYLDKVVNLIALCLTFQLEGNINDFFTISQFLLTVAGLSNKISIFSLLHHQAPKPCAD
jgi:hypothetical protein